MFFHHFFFNMFLFLFLAALGLCCSQVFLPAVNGGCSSLWCAGLVVQKLVASSQTRAPVCISCVGKQILNHWTAIEVPITFLQQTFSVIVWSTSPCRHEAVLFSPLHGGRGPEHCTMTQHAACRALPCFCI